MILESLLYSLIMIDRGEVSVREFSPNPRKIPKNILQFVEVLKQLAGVNEIILHGSSVSGRYRKNSDWDLGVICRGVTATDIDGHLRQMGISIEQVGKLNVDVRVFTQEEIELFKREGRVTGHPMKARMISNMLFLGKRL